VDPGLVCRSGFDDLLGRAYVEAEIEQLIIRFLK
jgi:hypothetical protein